MSTNIYVRDQKTISDLAALAQRFGLSRSRAARESVKLVAQMAEQITNINGELRLEDGKENAERERNDRGVSHG